MRKAFLLVCAAVAALALPAGDAPAHAAPVPPLQARVDAILTEFPGGVQLDANTISWRDGETVLDLATDARVTARAFGSCTAGRYCAWSGWSYTGSKLTFSACSASGSSSSVLPLGVARSFANARSSGTVNVRNGSTVNHTLAAGAGTPSITATTTNMICFT